MCLGLVVSIIDLFHNGNQIWYSFVLMLISPISLDAMGTIQKNVSTKVRPVGLINIYTKGKYYVPPFMKVVYFTFKKANRLLALGNRVK